MQAVLAAGRLEVGRLQTMEAADAPAGAHGVDDDRLGAALEVTEGAQARRAGVERASVAGAQVALGQAAEHVQSEAVVAVPGIAEADDVRGHQSVKLPRRAPLASATCTVQTRHASWERTT
jgi:hypothetical protein